MTTLIPDQDPASEAPATRQPLPSSTPSDGGAVRRAELRAERRRRIAEQLAAGKQATRQQHVRAPTQSLATTGLSIIAPGIYTTILILGWMLLLTGILQYGVVSYRNEAGAWVAIVRILVSIPILYAAKRYRDHAIKKTWMQPRRKPHRPHRDNAGGEELDLN